MKSSRLQRKALLPIAGKPMIDHLVERMKASQRAADIVLCTSTHPDDAILQETAEKYGIKFFRGSEEDVMGRFIAAAEAHNFDAIVRVTGDNPLTDPVHVDKLIDSHIQTGADFSKIEMLPLGVNCEVISLSTLKKGHDLAADPNLSEYMTAYLKQPKYFKINVFEDVDPYLRHPTIRLTVDEQQDMDLMNVIYGKLYTEDGKIFPLQDVIKLLTEDQPNLLRMNDNIPERALPKILMKGDPVADKPKIVLFGANMRGHAGVIVDMVEEFSMYNIVGFFDNNTNLHNTMIGGIPVLGGLDEFPAKVPEGVEGFFVAAGDNTFREQCHNLVKQHNLNMINIIHPSAIVPKNTQLGEGIFIGAKVALTSNVQLGNGVIVNTGSTIDHDNVLEDFSFVGPGCHTGGRVTIKRKAFLGTGVKAIPDTIIGEGALVGAGGVVVNDVEPNAKAVGVPAVKIGDRE